MKIDFSFLNCSSLYFYVTQSRTHGRCWKFGPHVFRAGWEEFDGNLPNNLHIGNKTRM